MKSVLITIAIFSFSFFLSCKKDKQPEPIIRTKAVVTTLAGSDPGFLDGSALSAKFFGPRDVVALPDGSIYVTDLSNNRIRKISGGQVTTLAGNGNAGSVNGNGTNAQFFEPSMLALDQSGNVYTLEGSNPQVRKITPNANVSLFAGTGIFGFADGTVATAKFRQSWGILVDPQGNIIVADTYNDRIRKISISGQVTTLAGSGVAGYRDGDGPVAMFDKPGGIAMDNAGNIYIADVNNHRIRKLSSDGKVSTFSGSGIKGLVDGPMGLAQFYSTFDMVMDKQGNLIVTDGHSIRKITPQGEVSTILGFEGGLEDGDSSKAKFYNPAGLAIDAAGDIYVADAGNYKVRKISFVPVK